MKMEERELDDKQRRTPKELINYPLTTGIKGWMKASGGGRVRFSHIIDSHFAINKNRWPLSCSVFFSIITNPGQVKVV